MTLMRLSGDKVDPPHLPLHLTHMITRVKKSSRNGTPNLASLWSRAARVCPIFPPAAPQSFNLGYSNCQNESLPCLYSHQKRLWPQLRLKNRLSRYGFRLQASSFKCTTVRPPSGKSPAAAIILSGPTQPSVGEPTPPRLHLNLKRGGGSVQCALYVFLFFKCTLRIDGN